ncbi:FAD:protein FMN transferase [Treponema sp.]|uniref:FAD:protein FMN transferase n=1 Tax=Treponema sp. TaxID=166 RepID=UPI00388D8436
MKSKLKAFFVVAFFLFIFSFFSCSTEDPRYEYVLGTICFVNLYDKGSDKLYNKIFDRLNQIDDEFNLNKLDSDISRVNLTAHEKPVQVPDEVFYVIKSALKIAAVSNGSFDPSVQPLVNLWGINTENPHVPSKKEVEQLLPLVDFKNIILNEENKTVSLNKEDMCIDLGAIVKGFAANEIVKICKEYSVKQAVIDLGGNVYVYGVKKGGDDWRVGIKNPIDPEGPPLISVYVKQTSVVTSGAYERYFEADAKRYHHILSTENGYPVENDLLSTTVICDNSMLADCLSTTFFTLGFEKSRELLPLLEKEFKTDLGLVLILKDHSVWVSENCKENCVLLAEDWKKNS